MFIDFYKCQKLATELLAKQHLSTTKINAMKLIYDKGIMIYSIQEYAQTVNRPISDFYQNGKLVDGYTIKIPKDNINLVLYNENMCKCRINWTIAHEIGHIYLEHTQDFDKEEVEAHFFAAQLLMPESVLCKLNEFNGQVTEKDLISLFYVSKDAAERRITTFQNKTNYSHTLEDEIIWIMLESFIIRYCDEIRKIVLKNPLPYINEDDDNYKNTKTQNIIGFMDSYSGGCYGSKKCIR